MGASTLAARTLEKGTVLLRETPLVLVYPTFDLPWIAELRAELLTMSEACAWQYIMAMHCLSAEDMPRPAPSGLKPMAPECWARLLELCGDESDGPSTLAICTAKKMFWQSREKEVSDEDPEMLALATRLEEYALRVSRNGFQVMDLKARPPCGADALFHRPAFLNHCCGGLNSASWSFDGAEGLMTVKTTREVAEGEELTISYIGKPWSELAKPARRRYLKQNYNFVCLCKACTQPAKPSTCEEAPGQKRPNNKLGALLTRWLQEDRDEVDEEAPEEVLPQKAAMEAQVSPQAQPAAAAAPAAASKGPLTDDERLERVLKRCEGEDLQVSREQAQQALQLEAGHVGKAMIRLRRGS